MPTVNPDFMSEDPLLLLDNNTLVNILLDGDYRFTNIKFDEAKAIMEMKGTDDIVRVFANPDLEHIMFEYLGMKSRPSPTHRIRRCTSARMPSLSNFTSPLPARSQSCWEMQGSRQKRLEMCIFTASILFG